MHKNKPLNMTRQYCSNSRLKKYMTPNFTSDLPNAMTIPPYKARNFNTKCYGCTCNMEQSEQCHAKTGLQIFVIPKKYPLSATVTAKRKHAH